MKNAPLIALLFFACAALKTSAQTEPAKFQVYKNEHFGIQFKYMPGFVIEDKCTDNNFALNLKYKSLAEVYSIKILPQVGSGLKETANTIYKYFKENDGTNKSLTNYKISDIVEDEVGFTFLETFELEGVGYDNLIMLKDLPTKNSPGVMVQVEYESQNAKSVSEAAMMLMATIHTI